MPSSVRYIPDGRELDLSDLSDDEYQLLEKLRGRCSKNDPVLWCPKEGGGSMYVQTRNGHLWAIHHNAHSHKAHRIWRMSDEHRRANDYFVRAGEDAGYRTAVEVKTDTGTRLDSVIFGPHTTGIEVQHSGLSKRAAFDRTKQSLRAQTLVHDGHKLDTGVLPVWFDPDAKNPKWFHHVPSVGCNKIPWDVLPARRSLTATGLRQIRAVKCRPGEFDRCPETRRNACGKWHPKPEPPDRDHGVRATVDDVAAMVPAGGLVPLDWFERWVYLVDPESLTLYEQLTGKRHRFGLDVEAHPERSTSKQEPRECRNPIHPPSALTATPQEEGTCCSGESLKLRCQVCPDSPTYWRRDRPDPNDREAVRPPVLGGKQVDHCCT